MANENLLEDMAKIASGGGGFAAVLVAGRWLINWATGRYDRVQARLDAQAAEIDARWKAYTKHTEERCTALLSRCDALEKEVEKCHADKREFEGRIAKLEGFDSGMGDRRSDKSLIAALEHRIAALEKGKGA